MAPEEVNETVVFPADGDAFEQPIVGTETGSGNRQWSSLKGSSSPPAAREDDRERAKSLPAYVRSPSQTEAELSPAEGEIPTLTSELKSNNKSEDESSEDTPSM